jgi:hypothetical protein
MPAQRDCSQLQVVLGLSAGGFYQRDWLQEVQQAPVWRLAVQGWGLVPAAARPGQPAKVPAPPLPQRRVRSPGGWDESLPALGRAAPMLARDQEVWRAVPEGVVAERPQGQAGLGAAAGLTSELEAWAAAEALAALAEPVGLVT